MFAYYPTNHPPWTTHQYVADTVLVTLLRMLRTGMGCADDISKNEAVVQPSLPESTAADEAE
eukprot:12755587-Ditylum_brightwellii.AAC.1